MPLNDEDRAKREAGYRAVDAFVTNDTCIGLGTGSTTLFAIERVAQHVRAGLSVRAVATSVETERLCRESGIRLAAYDDEPIDVAIDGADEVAPDWSLVKGGGGALFREKAIALAARRFVVIVTERKLVPRLGAFAGPLEVVPFSVNYVRREVEALGAPATLRSAGGKPFFSDNGNAILDCAFGTIDRPAELDAILHAVHGVVSTGLFVGLTSHVFVGRPGGRVDELAAPSARA